MNIKWIIIGLIGLIIFVMMGNNPFEMPEGFVHKDPVKDSVEKRARGEALESDGSGFWSGVPQGFGGHNGFDKNPGFGSNINGLGPGIMAPTLQNSPPPNFNPQLAAPQQPTSPASKPSTPGSPFDNLPSKSGFGSPDQAKPQALPPGVKLYSPPYIPDYETLDGKSVRFNGDTVYTQDEKGAAIIAPDGEYKLNDGTTVTVKNGRNQWEPPPVQLADNKQKLMPLQ